MGELVVDMGVIQGPGGPDEDRVRCRPLPGGGIGLSYRRVGKPRYGNMADAG